MFYVYEWFIKNTNEIFYVGKGTNKRYKIKKHNKLFNYILENNDCESRIIKYFETEKEAFDYEYQRINELWSIGQCKANIYKGGMGGTIEWWTNEKREWYSKNNCMKSQEQRERMSLNNPMKNKDIVKIVKEKISRKVVIDDVIYNSVLDVCEKYNVCYPTVKKWCEKGINNLGQLCRYEDEEQVIFSGKRYNKGGCKEVLYKNKIYESPLDIADEFNVSKHVVYRWIRKGFDKEGNLCQYINGKHKNCEQANQQPSHENSDKSIVEGSTTNE